MASSRKRLAYDSETESDYSSSDSQSQDEYYPERKYANSINYKKSVSNNSITLKDRQPTRTPTVFNRNAVMARENRIKKKQYVDNLEKDVEHLRDQNTKLNSIMGNQSFAIAELRKELKYAKSLLTNSSDIAQLLSSLQRNTGMSVNSSLLSRSRAIKCDYISKNESSTTTQKHPWEETYTSYPHFPTPDSPEDNMFNLDLPFSDSELMNLPLCDDFPMLDFDKTAINEVEQSKVHLSEHNYTSSECNIKDEAENVGICLHVSNRRVSLEFCSTCNDNAVNNWNRTQAN